MYTPGTLSNTRRSDIRAIIERAPMIVRVRSSVFCSSLALRNKLNLFPRCDDDFAARYYKTLRVTA